MTDRPLRAGRIARARFRNGPRAEYLRAFSDAPHYWDTPYLLEWLDVRESIRGAYEDPARRSETQGAPATVICPVPPGKFDEHGVHFPWETYLHRKQRAYRRVARRRVQREKTIAEDRLMLHQRELVTSDVRGADVRGGYTRLPF